MSRLDLFPLALTVLFAIALLIPLFIGVGNKHIPLIFSYISDSGANPPESCIFGQFMHFLCILYFCVAYIRYKQIDGFYRTKFQRKSKANIAAFIMSMMSILGISMVANFQETNEMVGHLFGAFLAFIPGAAWSCMNAYLTFKLIPEFSNIVTAYVRFVLGVCGLVGYIVSQITAVMSVKHFKPLDVKATLQWKEEDPGFELRGVSVVVEWLMVFIFAIYILTFVPEFKNLDYQSPRITLKNAQQSPLSNDVSEIINDSEVIKTGTVNELKA